MKTKELVVKISSMMLARGATLATAESCTGGMIATAITDVSGVSGFFKGSVVAYSAEVKTSLLGVPADMISRFGVVSCEVAEAMADGAARVICSDFAVSTTGVAGPGDQDGVPAGTVCIALHTPAGTISKRCFFADAGRELVRKLAVEEALEMLAAKC